MVEARERGLPVMGELELAWRLLGERPSIAVTGTNGKTTTIELLGAIHREAGVPHAVVGNVGTAASSLVDQALAPEAVIVAEASSFQLEDTLEFAPEAAALLNLEPDHLDRHGTLEAYREAKLLAFARQGDDAVAYAPEDFAVPGRARRVDADLDGWEIRLRGPHNRANARAAAAIALARGIPEQAVRAALRHVRRRRAPPRGGRRARRRALRQRLEGDERRLGARRPARVPRPPGARAARRAGQGPGLRAAARGGRRPVPHRRGRGQARGRAAAARRASTTLDEALAAARANAAAGDVVLLSPACASFDQFRDFEARGDHFRDLLTQD